MSWSTQSGRDATSVFLFCFHLLNPFVVRLFWNFLFFLKLAAKQHKTISLSGLYICFLIFLPTLKMGFVLWIHLEVQKRLSAGKKNIDERGRPSNKIPFKEAFKQLPKIPIAVLLPHFFVDPKKKPCFFGSSRVVVGFFDVLFFWFLGVFDSTQFPHGWKKKHHRKISVDVGYVGQVCFLWRAPIANTNTWTELPGGIQWGQLSCYAY